MLDDLSPAVERALSVARQNTADGSWDVFQVMLALIADDDGRAAQMLLETGANLERARDLLSACGPQAFDFPPVLSEAREAAGLRDEPSITGEYLLMGLIRAFDSLHAPLRSSGARLDRFLEQPVPPVIEMAESLNLGDPIEHLATARIVDVNANRAREALRVLDDYCRFVLNDATLTELVKQARHALVDVLSKIPESLLISARETLRDVGTTITATGEMVRSSPAQVAIVNVKRLQESLRSLEEFGKLIGPEVAARLESLRYQAYTLERSLSINADARQRLDGAKVYVLLTGSQCLASLDWTIREAADGGADIFQLREKGLSDRDLIERARNVRRWTNETRTLFIMNDRPDIARLVGADGVHLGQDDLSVHDARQVLGNGPLIGVSTHHLGQVRQAVLDGASYIGMGPTFPSTTKSFAEFAGLEFIRSATEATSLPAFAIGGITALNVAQVAAAGATRVAVSAAVCQAEDPATAARRLRIALTQ